MNGYELSRNFVDFAFENPSKIKPNHYAVFFFSIEHCNRLGWKKEFGLPTTMAMEAIGIKSYNTYSKTLNELVKYGFIIMIEKSRNQYSSNIIALSNFNKALDKALDKAFIKHTSKHKTKHCRSTRQSTRQSIDSINKQLTNKPFINNKAFLENSISDVQFMEISSMQTKTNFETIKKYLEEFERFLVQQEIQKESLREFKQHFTNWLNKQEIKKVVSKIEKPRYA